jgi:predicted transcriptional regulator of viral defense system
VHPVLRQAADRRLGVFTAAEARLAGYPDSEIRSAGSSGRWVRLRRGVYVTATDLARLEDRNLRHAVDCMAVIALLHRRDAVVSHTSAARLRGWPVQRDTDRTIRLTDPAQWRRGEGYLLSRAPLPGTDRTGRGPVPMTSPARTLVDCAREWPLEDAVVAMDAALLREDSTPGELAAAVAAAHRWPGAPRAARAAFLADGRAESPLETRGRLRIVGSGLPVPELQVEIRRDGALLAVVDAWYADAAVAVEFDGRLKYTDPWRDRTAGQVLWEEKRREDELRALGIRFVRVTDIDVQRRWGPVAERLRALLAQPGPSVRTFTATPRERGLVRAR